ncbi:MAG TPA: hypothetical protein DIC22_05810 [Chitinophagaceae bacterium]|nr:hypothetical protein [Chitinophagaceae bacterium]
MNFRMITNTGKVIALAAAISLASCKKDSTPANSNESTAATLSDSSTAADNMYYDVLNNAFVGYEDNSSVWSTTSVKTGQTTTFSTGSLSTAHLGCAIYSIDDTVPGQYPKTLTMDFGSGCTGADGIFRSGKISYLFTGPMLYPGSTATVTFNQYVVNGYGLQGSYTISNNSSQAGGIIFSTQVTNGIITYPDASIYHYASARTYTMTAGSATPNDITDDVYSITGNSSFSASTGAGIVFNITTPLVKAISCHNISAGVVSFVYNQVVSGTIDFGNGTCDNLATLTIGTVQKTIMLR